MALQPAAGVRDLNPQQVELNHRLCGQLANVYRLWGYKEVSPPKIERLATLLAGGAIEPHSVIQVVADEALGLRPEMTASIARAACTRMSGKLRPLRLWSTGTTFQSRVGASGGLRIEETLQSGVEILGIHNNNADMELLHLLLSSVSALPLEKEHHPQLLIGHHCILSELLEKIPPESRIAARDILTGFDPLAIKELKLKEADLQWLDTVMRMRGEPLQLLSNLRTFIGPTPTILEMERIFNSLIPRAEEVGISIQFDPSFEPQLDLYNGLVFQLVCIGSASPLIIANGGRYDSLVAQFGASDEEAAGVGFSFAIEEIRELIFPQDSNYTSPGPHLIAYSEKVSIEEVFIYQRKLHIQGIRAEIQLTPCKSREEAESIANIRGAISVEWLDT